tara:strand:- start:57 stop:1775 length:1719 start_codon:yes stop_codon:yes gene_type:complete
MQKLLFLTVCLLFLNSVSAQQINEVKVKTSIKELTVFLTGGEVTRSSHIRLKKGRNKIIYTGISTVIDQKSIQFSANKSQDLVSVSTEIDHISYIVMNPRIKKIKDSLEIITDIQSDLRNEKSAYQSEKTLLQKNNSIKGTQQNLSVEELRSMAEYYRKRMMELNKILTDYDKRIKVYNNRVYQYNQQLSELNYKESVRSNQVIVILDSDIAQEINTELKYIVSNCGWQANYDLSAEDIEGKIKLKYKAKVYNNTGNDWNNIKLVLSTSNPNISASAPTLSPWYLNGNSVINDDSKSKGYIVPQKQAYKKYYQNSSAPQQNQQLDGLSLNGTSGWNNESGNIQNNPSSKTSVQITTIQVPQLSSEFNIEKEYTIPTDSKPYLVEISEHELDATFSHKSVPKLDKDAFLLANIVGWEKLNLISGPTNVYYADTYVGQSYINTRNVEDTLRLSFGRDKKVLITRKKLEEFSNKNVIGGNKKDTYTFEITVKNNRNIPLNMKLYDQIPVSQESDITVTIEDISGAVYNEENGILFWDVSLAPNEALKYKISFTIKYPKNKSIKVQKFRTISCPSF